MLRKKFIYTLVLSSLFLSSCSNETKRSLGLIKKNIDEFQVIKKAPLSLPPNITLRPPRKGSLKESDLAKSIVLGEERDFRGTIDNSGEISFLKTIGATKADPNIKKRLRARYEKNIVEDKFVDRIMFFKPKSQMNSKGKVVDPILERNKIIQKKKKRSYK